MSHDSIGWTYRVFGFVVSSDLPVPGLTPVESHTPQIDIRLYMGASPSAGKLRLDTEEPWYVSSYLDALGEPALRIWRAANSGLYRLAYTSGLTFWLDCPKGTIWATWPDGSGLNDAAPYLLGPVFGIFLRLRGFTCLHASVVAMNDFAVGFVGPPGAGKSTTAAALTIRGCAAVSDDIALLRENPLGSFHVVPAYPYLCLWPESVKLMYGSSSALPQINSRSEKRRLLLSVKADKFETRTLPLGAIYLLGERVAKSAPVIEAISSQTALVSLVADTYATNTLDAEMRAKEFEILGRLVSKVPIRRLHAQENAGNLDELCDAIRDNLGLGPNPPKVKAAKAASLAP
jgi:hypothetical protein